MVGHQQHTSNSQQMTWPSGLAEAFAEKGIADMEKRLLDLCAPVLQQLGLELYDLQYSLSQSKLVLFIQNPATGTAVIEECIAVDRALGPVIEAAEWIPNNFVLEVSSPGVNRQLRFRNHFEKALNNFVQLQLHRKLEPEQCPGLPKKFWNNKKLRGKLTAFHASGITLDVDGASVAVNCQDIKKAVLDPDLFGGSGDSERGHKKK